MKVRKSGIATKIFIAVIALLVISDGLIGALAYNRAKNLLVSQIKDKAKNIVSCIGASVDGSLFASINEGDVGSDDYNKVLDVLALYRDNSGVEYVYTIVLDDAGVPVFAVIYDLIRRWVYTMLEKNKISEFLPKAPVEEKPEEAKDEK